MLDTGRRLPGRRVRIPAKASTTTAPRRVFHALHSSLEANSLLTFLLVGGLYALGAYAAWDYFEGVVFFPPAGVTAAAILLLPRSRWPAIVAAILVVETVVDVRHDVPFASAAGFGLANAVEPVVAALIFAAFSASPELQQRRDVRSFLVAAVACGPLVAGMIGATVRIAQEEGGNWALFVAQWAAGDAVAVLVLGGSILLVRGENRPPRWWLEAAAFLPVMVVVALLSMSTDLPTSLFTLPLFALLALRLGPAGVTLSALVVSVVASFETGHDRGPFAQLSVGRDTQLLLMQLTLMVLVLTAWWLSVEVGERRQAVARAEVLQRDRERGREAIRILERALRPRDDSAESTLEVGTCYRPAGAGVGGDWFDSMQLPDGRTLLVVGDVVGHGLDAIEDMTQLRYASRALAFAGHDIREIPASLSHMTEVSKGRYATIALAAFDPARSEYTIVVAGHPPPILVTANPLRAEVIAVRPGVPLGVTPDVSYDSVNIRAGRRDALVMYTDGLIERAGHTIDDGLKQLTHFLEQPWGPRSVQAMCDAATSSCFADVPPQDDICVLIARPTGADRRPIR